MSSTTGDNISKPPTEDDGPPIKSANCHRKIGLPVLPTTKSVSSDAGDQDGNGTTIDIGKFQLHADGDFLFAVRLSGLLFALEIDPHLDGNTTMKSIMIQLGGLPMGPTVLSPHGRILMLFCTLEENKIGSTMLGPGVRVKAGGDYAMLPPSRMLLGPPYRWLCGTMASDMAIPRIPYEWIEYTTYCCVDDSLRDSAETDEAARGLEHRSKLLDLAAATVNTTLWSPYPRILTDWPPKHGVNIE